jgi:hypothetical protein
MKTMKSEFRTTRLDGERLHQLAAAEGVSINTLALRGLSKLFEVRGLPGMAIAYKLPTNQKKADTKMNTSIFTSPLNISTAKDEAFDRAIADTDPFTCELAEFDVLETMAPCDRSRGFLHGVKAARVQIELAINGRAFA